MFYSWIDIDVEFNLELETYQTEFNHECSKTLVYQKLDILWNACLVPFRHRPQEWQPNHEFHIVIEINSETFCFVMHIYGDGKSSMKVFLMCRKQKSFEKEEKPLVLG